MKRYLGLGPVLAIALALGQPAPALADTIHFTCTPAGAAARPFHVSFDTAANTVTDQGVSHPMQVTPTDVTWTWPRVAPDQAPAFADYNRATGQLHEWGNGASLAGGGFVGAFDSVANCEKEDPAPF
jgi:hypothetical protein